MVAADAIARLDLLMPNTLPEELKLDWLAALEGWVLHLLPPHLLSATSSALLCSEHSSQGEGFAENSPAPAGASWLPLEVAKRPERNALSASAGAPPSLPLEGKVDGTAGRMRWISASPGLPCALAASPGEGLSPSPPLLVPDPYAEEIYVNYLLAKAALSLGEPELFSLYYNVFYAALNRFAAAVNRRARRPARQYRF